ncbi:MAG TPA: glutathione-disulfide reductase, partial [Hyphomicrobiaceae bacterium]
MNQYDFDLFVIGGGSGGVRAARIAGGHGARVAIAEEYRFGGTCVIRGCIPKKLLVYASRFSDDFEDAAGFGWTVEGTRFDWPTLIANKDREIARLEGLYRGTVGNAGATVFDTRATIVDPHTVALAGDGRKITARVILVATGGHPVKPDIPGAEHAITSNEAFHLKELPASILIAGGGYIAVEFAGIFHGLGARTTLAYRGEKLLRGFDDDLRTGLMEEMARRGIDVRVKADPASIGRSGRGYAVTMRDGSTVEAACVMFATGRAPNTRGLGLEEAGVKLGARGEIVVDAESRSSVPSIYAVGDVTDRVNLTPVAIREGHAFADTVFGVQRWTVEHDLIPTAVFSTPEIGTVGLPEHIACQRYPDLDCYRARFRPLKNTLSGRDERV